LLGAGGVKNVFGFGGNTRGQNSLDEIKNKQLQIEAELAGQQERLNPARQSLEDRLVAQGLGQAPSVADMQMKQALDRSLQQQIAAAKSARGVNPALASRNAAMAGAQMQAQVAPQAAINKVQEQQQNQGVLADYLSNLRTSRTAALGAGANTALAQTQSDLLKKQADQGVISGLMDTGSKMFAMSDENEKKDKKPAKAEEALAAAGKAFAPGQSVQVTGLNGVDNMMQNIINQPMDFSASQDMGKSMGGFAQALKDKFGQQSGAGPMAAASPQNINEGQFAAAAAGLGAGGMGMGNILMPGSDEKIKKNVKSGSKETSQFLDALKAYKYKYKNPDMPGQAPGPQVSVMAQDLEKAGPMGKQMVQDTPNGKMVDYGRGFGAILAAQAELNKRLKNLEKKG